jgi:hypothetical protein
MLITNKKAFDHLAYKMADFAMAPSWMNMTKLMDTTMADHLRGKYF